MVAEARDLVPAELSQEGDVVGGTDGRSASVPNPQSRVALGRQVVRGLFGIRGVVLDE